MKRFAIFVVVLLFAAGATWAGVSVSPQVSVMIDGTFDAAGDILVGTADNTAGRVAIGTANQVLTSNGTTASWVSGLIGTLTGNVISASNGDISLTPNGTGDIRLALDSGTALYASTTFSLDSSGNLDAAGTGNFTGALTGGSLNTAGAITIPTYFTVSAVGALDAASYGSFSYLTFGAEPADAGTVRFSNNTGLAWEAASPGVDLTLALSAADVLTSSAAFTSSGAITGASLAIPTNFTVSAAGALDAASYGSFSYMKFGADPADAGVIRLSNATYILSEADAASTDISVIGVDASEVVQIAASGASGVTITPALTVTGGLVSPKMSGHVTSTGTVPTASAGTIDTKSTDHVGVITSVGATETIVTFASAYTAKPVCVATASDEPVWIVGASTTGFTITATANIDDANYACFEIE